MQDFTPLRHLNPQNQYGSNDVFVLFGELFSRGYANGLVDEAKKAGMKIIGITVGRRDAENNLRALTAEELQQAEENLGGTIINVPHWAGFDMDAADDGTLAKDLLAGVKTKGWEDYKLDWDKINQAKARGTKRFQDTCATSMKQLEGMIPDGANVLFAHTMAGGIPKSKVLLVLTNRAVKGTGKRFLSSQEFWDCEAGKMAQENFYAVTANTFQDLIDASAGIRNKVEGQGGKVSYTAYGYHGTEILINDKQQWQTYNPYLQGLAKIRLEEIACKAWDQGIKATVFNCPEIRTNSSDLFSGVELSLYPLITALQKAGDTAWTKQVATDCAALLKEGESLENMLEVVNKYHANATVQHFYNHFEQWPMHNTSDLADTMLSTADQVMGMNEDRKKVVTDLLSNIVVESSGTLMINEAFAPTAPVLWVNHDIIAKEQVAKHK